MNRERVTTAYFRKAKEEHIPITILTAYDCAMARMIDAADIDVILVGDSVGNVLLGYDSTIPVTMEEMIHHIRAVTKGVKRAMVVGDMPFLSYHISSSESIRNAGRLLQEGGAQSVKLEGGREVADNIRAIVSAGIPVMGHLGLTPQSIHQMGGYKVQGKDEAAAQKLIEDAKIIQEAGVFSIVLECIPSSLAKILTESLNVPTIGIGAGLHCDGQVLVTHDMLGMYGEKVAKFVKRYANLYKDISRALEAYRNDVKNGQFPGPEHCYNVSEELAAKLKT